MTKTIAGEPVTFGRWRIPGGRVVHWAAQASTGDGWGIALVCDPHRVRWFANDCVERLALRKRGQEPLTCATCRRSKEERETVTMRVGQHDIELDAQTLAEELEVTP